jgi:type IV pilus assembly protein PilP
VVVRIVSIGLFLFEERNFSMFQLTLFLKKISYRYFYQCCVGVIVILLSACSSDMTDLERFIAETKGRKNPNVEPLPKFEIVPNYFYEVDNMRDPFEPLIEQGIGNARIPLQIDENNDDNAGMNCPKPDTNRVRVGLELMPLDALQMVGTLQEGETFWGLVISKTTGTLYKVKVGDYMGRYHGRVSGISENKIEVIELVPDNKGCYSEQVNTIKLRE